MQRELSSRQMEFVQLLLSGASVPDAAKAVGISRATAWRWSARPAVVAALQRAQGDALQRASNRMSVGVMVSLDVLESIMRDKSVSAAVRVRAAAVWLDAWRQVSELADIERRLSALETRENERQETTGTAGTQDGW